MRDRPTLFQQVFGYTLEDRQRTYALIGLVAILPLVIIAFPFVLLYDKIGDNLVGRIDKIKRWFK